MEDICIYVANHKDADSLAENPYRLLRVGSTEEAALCSAKDCLEGGASDGIQKEIVYDSCGDSIAYKNFAYCELTGLYWIWKNSCHDITGMVHYRRYLTMSGSERPLDAEEIEQGLEAHDVLVARPARLSSSLAENYCACHVSFDLAVLMDVMERQPDNYRLAFSEVMGSNTIIPFNIMIARKPLLDSYCEWLFLVLGQCEERIDLYAGRDDYQRRAFGFLAERLLMVWLVANDVDCGFYDVLTFGEADIIHDVEHERYVFDFMSGIRGLAKSQLFDDEFYRNTYDDVAAVYPPGKAIDHYLEFGIKEGRAAAPAYSMDEYANLRPRLRAKIGEMSPRFMGVLSREAMLRNPVLSRNIVLGVTRSGLVDYKPVYDWLYYTSKYDDVPGDYFHTELALRHFIEVGIPEGRQGSKGFSLDAYKERHPELVRRFGEDNRRYYMHYLRTARHCRAVDWRYVG